MCPWGQFPDVITEYEDHERRPESYRWPDRGSSRARCRCSRLAAVFTTAPKGSTGEFAQLAVALGVQWQEAADSHNFPEPPTVRSAHSAPESAH